MSSHCRLSSLLNPSARSRAIAEAIKTSLIKAAGGWGYSYKTERRILGASRRVDLVLTKGDLVVACEISATTAVPHELANVRKCLQAGFARLLHICDAKVRRRRLAGLLARECSPEELRRVEFLSAG